MYVYVYVYVYVYEYVYVYVYMYVHRVMRSLNNENFRALFFEEAHLSVKCRLWRYLDAGYVAVKSALEHRKTSNHLASGNVLDGGSEDTSRSS